MARLKIGEQIVEVDDGFLQLPPDQQQSIVDEIASSLGNGILPRQQQAAPAAPPADPRGAVTADNVARAAARGIPVVGGLMDNFAAGMDAVTNPLLGRGSAAPSLAERYQQNLQAEQGRDKAFDEQSPVTSTVAQMGGGVGAILPLAATKVGAKLLGLTGRTLPEMVRRGALSGAGLGAADAVTRGDDPATAAGVGGAMGALVPVVGAGVGAGVRGVRNMMAPAQPLAQEASQAINVAGQPVRMSQSQMTGDAAQSAEEQVYRRTGPTQPLAQEWAAGQQAELGRADAAVRAGLDPSGRAVGATPAVAADAVQTELTAAANARAAADAAAQARAAQEGTDIALAAGGGRTVADAPYTAGEILSAGVRRQATAARQARDDAYATARGVDVEITPSAFDRADVAIRNALNEGDRVRLNERTPRANEAIDTIRRTVAGEFQQTDQLRPPPQPGPDGRTARPNLTGTDIDELRKDLIAMQRQANAAARGSGDNTDVRAMQRVISAFDDLVENAVTAGTVRGDGDRFLQALRAARQAHRDYRSGFGPRDSQDEVGKIIEKIVGRADGRQAEPSQVAQWAYGSASSPGGAQQVKVARRFREMFGEGSDEWAAYKQGLLAHLTETAPGTAPYTPQEVATRVLKFIGGTQGRGLAQEAFTPAELARLQNHAANVAATAPRARPTNNVEKAMQRITGEDGNSPATVNEIVGMLYGSKGMGNTSLSVPLAQRLKRDLTPESWDKVKLGLYSHLTEVPEGMITKKEQALSQQLHQFLNGQGRELAETVFTERERNLIGQIADAYRRMIPVEGTTNPSGTAPMMAKIVGKLQNVLLPLLGFSQGGMVGAGVAVAAQKGLEHVTTKKAMQDATRRFYGEQPRAQVTRGPQSRVPDAVARGAMPGLMN